LVSCASPAACAAVSAAVKRTSAESNAASGVSAGPTFTTHSQKPSPRSSIAYPAMAALRAMSVWRLGTCASVQPLISVTA
jgi:hypothetical protein